MFEINVSGTTRTIVPVNTYVTGNVGDVSTFAAASASASVQMSKKHKAVARPEDF